jgi:hypothetical protein
MDGWMDGWIDREREIEIDQSNVLHHSTAGRSNQIMYVLLQKLMRQQAIIAF